MTDAIGATSSTLGGATPTTTGTSALGKDDFLKLMVAQLKRQDPMNPVDDSQFLAQMAQFTSLEQLTNLGQTASTQLGATAASQALSLVGRTVTYTAADKTVRTGVVESVTFDGGVPTLTVSGVTGVSPATVTAVRDGAPPSTTTPDAGAAPGTTTTNDD